MIKRLIQEYKFKSVFIVGSVTFALSVLLTVISNLDSPNIKNIDFLAYYTGGKIVTDGKIRELYSTQLQLSYENFLVQPYKFISPLTFRNPPLWAVIISPLTIFTIRDATVAFLVVNILLYITALWLVTTRIYQSKLLLLLSLIFPPTLFAIIYGQISILLFSFLVVGYMFLSKEQYYKAGIVLGFMAFKPQLLILTLFIAALLKLKISIKYLLGVVTTLAIFLVLNILFFGRAFISTYLKFLFNTENLTHGTDITESFGLGSIYKLLQSLPMQMLVVFSACGLILLIGYIMIMHINTKRLNFDIRFITAILFAIPLSIHTMPSDLVLTLMVIYLLAKNKHRHIFKISISLFLVPFLALFKLGAVGMLIYILMPLLIIYTNEDSNIRILK